MFDSMSGCIVAAAISIRSVPVAADLFCISFSPYLQQVSCCFVISWKPSFAPELRDPQLDAPFLSA